jgi:hypothetical protein
MYVKQANLCITIASILFLFTIHLSHGLCYLSQAITAMVQKAMEYIDLTPDMDTCIELIKTLSSVSAGKVRNFPS